MNDPLTYVAPRRYNSRVLVAEDNPVHRSLVRSLLEQMGCDVQAVNDGHQAIEQFAGSSFDLIFMDWQMPKLDGVAATREIRKMEKSSSKTADRVPIIALTAHALPGDRNRCLDAGMDDYVCKPVSRRNLDLVLAKWSGAQDDTHSSPAPAAAADIDDEAVLDASQIGELAEIERDGAPGLVSHLIDTYLGDAPSKLTLLQTAARERDPLGVQVSMHSFKSASSTVGARRLYRLCHDLERDARAKNLEGLDARVEQIMAEFERVETELEKLKTTFTGSAAAS
jgi:CheY-like chemotaxis protein